MKQSSKKPKRRVVSAKLDSSKSHGGGVWRPASAHSGIPAIPEPIPGKVFPCVTDDFVVEDERPVNKVFYTEVGNGVGT